MKFLTGLGLVLLMVVAGCSPRITSSTTSKVTDSIHVKIVPRLVPVFLPGKEVTVNKVVNCDSLNQPLPFEAEEKTKEGAKVKVSLKQGGKLTVTGGCDSLKALMEVKDSVINRYRFEQNKTVVTKIEYRTRKIDIFCRWFTGVVLLLTIGYFFLKLNLRFPWKTN